MRFIGCVFFMLAITASVMGDNCRARVIQHHAAIEVQPVLLATVIPIAAYSVHYAPQSEDVRALVAEIRALRAEVQAIKAAPVTTPEKKELAPLPLKHLEIFQAKCGACHEAAISKAKGGGFTMLSGGKLALMTDRQLRKVGTRTYAGDMPPKGHQPLTDQEVSEVQRFLNSLE